MAIQYPQQSYIFVNAKTTSFPVDVLNTVSLYNSVYPISFNVSINAGLLIPCANKARHAKVLRSFNIEIQTVRGGFVAVSDISDVFELGETPGQAVLHYLYSIADELIWFQEQAQSLSLPMYKDFDKLKLYLKLV